MVAVLDRAASVARTSLALSSTSLSFILASFHAYSIACRSPTSAPEGLKAEHAQSRCSRRCATHISFAMATRRSSRCASDLLFVEATGACAALYKTAQAASPALAQLFRTSP
jgi:hypothetical protein